MLTQFNERLFITSRDFGHFEKFYIVLLKSREGRITMTQEIMELKLLFLHIH